MPHSLTTLAEVLDDLREPIFNAIGESVKTLHWCESHASSGGGKQIQKPLIVADDSGFGFISDGGSIAAANGGDPEQLVIPYRFFAGRWRVTGPTLEAAGEGRSQMVDAMQFPTEQFIRSASTNLDNHAWSGGRILGFGNERVNDADGGDSWEVAGDLAKIQALITALGGAITCEIIRMDTYATLATVELSAVNQTTGLVTIDDALDTSGIADGFGWAIRCTEAGLGMELEANGIMANLAEPTHFGLDRTDATGTTIPQAPVMTLGTADGHDTRGTITLARIRALLTEIKNRTRGQGRPSRFIYAPSLHGEMENLFQGAATMNFNVQVTEGSRVDAGIVDSGFRYAGIPMEEHFNCPDGMLVAISDDTWTKHMLGSSGWKGAPYDVQGADAVERAWTQYYNLACHGPNFNGALVGLDYDGAGDGAAV